MCVCGFLTILPWGLQPYSQNFWLIPPKKSPVKFLITPILPSFIQCNPMLNSLSWNGKGAWTLQAISQGSWEALGVSPHSRTALCLKAGQLSLLQYFWGEWVGQHHTSTFTWSSLLQLLTSSTTPLHRPLPAPQKVKTVAVIRSYAWRPPPLRGLSDIPNKRDLTAQLPRYFIYTSSATTFSFFLICEVIHARRRRVEKYGKD